MVLNVVQQRQKRDRLSIFHLLLQVFDLEARLVVQADKIDEVHFRYDSISIGCRIHMLRRAEGRPCLGQIRTGTFAFFHQPSYILKLLLAEVHLLFGYLLLALAVEQLEVGRRNPYPDVDL